MLVVGTTWGTESGAVAVIWGTAAAFFFLDKAGESRAKIAIHAKKRNRRERGSEERSPLRGSHNESKVLFLTCLAPFARTPRPDSVSLCPTTSMFSTINRLRTPDPYLCKGRKGGEMK